MSDFYFFLVHIRSLHLNSINIQNFEATLILIRKLDIPVNGSREYCGLLRSIADYYALGRMKSCFFSSRINNGSKAIRNKLRSLSRNKEGNHWPFKTASLFFAYSTSRMPGSASFKRVRNFSYCSIAFSLCPFCSKTFASI